jgi:ABC-type lipoprotein export system ATPase subunit
MKDPVLQFQQVCMTYPTAGAPDRQVLHEVSFTLSGGRAVALAGRSGSGKSTLLHLAAGIMVPTSGRVLLTGQDLSGLSEQQRTLRRRSAVGQVFQFFHLLPHLSVEENVSLPGWIAGLPPATTQSRVHELLARVQLRDRASDSVGLLSGGEMQRVAICRALLRHPVLVLADEPTGSLDDSTGQLVMDLLLDLVRDEGAALLFATHSRELARKADTAWHLVDGQLTTGDFSGARP